MQPVRVARSHRDGARLEVVAVPVGAAASANSGVYSGSRMLYGLSHQQQAPVAFGRLSGSGTQACCWPIGAGPGLVLGRRQLLLLSTLGLLCSPSPASQLPPRLHRPRGLHSICGSTVAHQSWGRVAALSRHKAAPTGTATTLRATLYLWELACRR
ncbi:hypothetical protein BL240_12810 [Pseudomonas putida]|uniref:Amino acid permease/ SLC12A domain-containing protein n=1 Tax=Pseudomonas putida TaxID=303 RepID=A0A1L5PQ34_PSEPU|nr:hypothetical protein BL240_12810 [Pseudomonas putida]